MPNVIRIILCACVSAGDQPEESPGPAPLDHIISRELHPSELIVEVHEIPLFEEKQEEVAANQLDIHVQQLQQSLRRTIEVHQIVHCL